MNALLGNCGFLDVCLPVKGKSEWGMDTLARKMVGARSLAEAFIAALAQGQGYQGYYLQSWDVDDNPNVATVTLFYKGLLTGGTPLPKGSDEIVTAVGQTNADYSDEGDPVGTGRVYRQDFFWSIFVPASGATSSTSYKALKDRYAVSARMEFTYNSLQTTWRYISQGQLFGPIYILPSFNFVPIIERARITVSDGTVLPRTVYWETFLELTPTVSDRVISHRSEPVIGSPYFECEDVVRRILGDP